jgi:hypothetical protein
MRCRASRHSKLPSCGHDVASPTKSSRGAPDEWAGPVVSAQTRESTQEGRRAQHNYSPVEPAQLVLLLKLACTLDAKPLNRVAQMYTLG